MDVVERIMTEHKPAYWGNCIEEEKWRYPHRDESDKYYVSEKTFAGDIFPIWAQGFAYTLDRDFLKCATSKFPDVPFMSMEDVATGIVASMCNVTCRMDDFDWWSGEDGGEKTPMVAMHYEEYLTGEHFANTHWTEMGKRGITG